MTNTELLKENADHALRHGIGEVYNPLTGEGATGRRVAVTAPDGSKCFIPEAMARADEFGTASASVEAWERLRVCHDFEFWCARCIVIKDKVSCRDVPFVLNRPQRRVAALLEEDRLAGRPLRLIMLKARQWGGSTLVQMYMAWIQLVHRRGWNSLICSHVKDTSETIRAMYERLLEDYPEGLADADGPLAFKPLGRAANTRVIAGRNCRVTVASAERHDSVRGADYAMAHLSETAFWPDTPMHSPLDLIRAVCGAIAYEPYTLIAMESTANGVGNYFHREWQRCASGQGDKRAVFVPWYEIEIYRRPLVSEEEAKALYTSMDEYERGLWEQGLTLEMIKWYRQKRREYPDSRGMQAEYPTTPEEAFCNTGAGVFDIAKVNALREGCRAPLVTGDLDSDGEIVEDAKGCLDVWEKPKAHEDYVISVDIGGRTSKADWSVICAMALGRGANRPRVVAQWRGHTDHDLLASEAVAIARFYNNGLMVVESNTLEQEAGRCADESLSVLARIADMYSNVYTRQVEDDLRGTTSTRIGFHTNRQTKPLVISELIRRVRELSYIERDTRACDELATYTQPPRGSYEARPGCHDDILMTRAIALYVAARHLTPVRASTSADPFPLQTTYL